MQVKINKYDIGAGLKRTIQIKQLLGTRNSLYSIMYSNVFHHVNLEVFYKKEHINFCCLFSFCTVIISLDILCMNFVNLIKINKIYKLYKVDK